MHSKEFFLLGLTIGLYRDISYAFAEHVESAKHTLFQNLNWLNRHLERILKNPRERPWQYVADTEANKPTETETPKQEVSSENKVESNVVVVDDPEALLPPGVTWDDIDKFTSAANHHGDGDGVTKPMVDQGTQQPDGEASSSTAAAGEAQPNMEQQQQQPAVRKGIEVRLSEPRFENCTLIRITSVDVLVDCLRCHHYTTFADMTLPDILSASGSNDEAANKKYERWVQCSTCSFPLGVRFTPGKISDGHVKQQRNTLLTRCSLCRIDA